MTKKHSLILRDIDFGTVIGASGIQGFFGEGYPYHKWFKFIPGFSFEGMTFCAKTVTVHPRKGNMPLSPKDKITPLEFMPASIAVSPLTKSAVNAVGLANPGIDYILSTGKWQTMNDRPFMISYMPVADGTDQIAETMNFMYRLMDQKINRKGVGLQLNISCPNTGHGTNNTNIEHIHKLLDILSELQIPIIPKINALVSVEDAIEISKHPTCDAICVSNTIPWNDLPFEKQIALFDSIESPLEKYWSKKYNGNPIFTIPKQSGGVSGAYLFPLVRNWVIKARMKGFDKPILAGGGIMSKNDVHALFLAGANAISPGSVVFLRPWRLQGIINTGREYFLD